MKRGVVQIRTAIVSFWVLGSDGRGKLTTDVLRYNSGAGRRETNNKQQQYGPRQAPSSPAEKRPRRKRKSKNTRNYQRGGEGGEEGASKGNNQRPTLWAQAGPIAGVVEAQVTPTTCVFLYLATHPSTSSPKGKLIHAHLDQGMAYIPQLHTLSLCIPFLHSPASSTHYAFAMGPFWANV